VSQRRLSPDERAIWEKVAASVKPLHPVRLQNRSTLINAVRVDPVEALPVPSPPQKKKGGPLTGSGRPEPAKSTPAYRHTLDGSWDKRLTKGDVFPDVTIDLHGETLATAHARLNRSLAAAIRNGARVILLITGKPAQDNPRLPPTSRGVIRASIHDWLLASSSASQIAAIRNAHPRHGGAGALYVILRRGR
jgi:DNA-nicking Smr family endonuclease